MPVSLSMHVEGLDKLQDTLDRISPRRAGSAWVRRAMHTCAERVQAIAADKMIIRGGRFRGPAGPRGGKGKLRDAAVDPDRLTSRTGTLRRSIRINYTPLPQAIEIGTDLIYGAVHEYTGAGKARKKRPFLAPALEKASKEFSRIFAKELGRELAR